jgi:hypothetical protein
MGDDVGNDMGNDDGRVDGGQWLFDGGQGKVGIDDGVMCGLGEYQQPELLVRKSHHCLILPTPFVMVLVVHMVGTVRDYLSETQNQEVKHTNILYLYPR